MSRQCIHQQFQAMKNKSYKFLENIEERQIVLKADIERLNEQLEGKKRELIKVEEVLAEINKSA